MHFDFIETFKRWVRRFFVVVGVFTTLFFALLFYFFYSSIKHIIPSTPSLPGQKEVVTLHLTLKGEITEKNNHFKMWGKLWSHNYENWNDVYLPEIKNALDKAAEDSKVNGLFLDLENLTGNLAQFTELRTILANFKKSGKPIHVWSAQFDYQTLYLASLADHISLAPYGDFMLMGPTFQLGYYHDTLKKLGIEFEVIRVGKYKSAAEPFLLSTPSAETLEMYQSLEKNLRDHVFKTIAEARKMPVAKVTQFFKQSIFTPREALASGLIDKLSYLDKSRDVIKDLVRGVPQDFYVYNMFLDSVGADFFESPKEEGIALIEASGEIQMGGGGSFLGDGITPQSLSKELQWARDDDHVKAVVFRISSPGGSASASDLIWHEMKALAEKKPVVVSVGSYGASGGYYLIAPATKIYAEPTSLLGAIGVFSIIPRFKELGEKLGLNYYVISSSDRKDLLNPFKSLGQEDKKFLERLSVDFYDGFIAKVAEGRKHTTTQIRHVAEGRVWTGEQSLELGLIDALGGLSDALQEAKSLAQLDKNKKYPILQMPIFKRSLSSCFSDTTYLVDCLSMLGSASSKEIFDVKDMLSHVKTFLSSIKKDSTQALWFDYLGFSDK